MTRASYRQTTAVLLAVLLASGCAVQTDAGDGAQVAETEKSAWLTDFAAAKAEAARRGVPILADFSGSDWCGWCIKLDKEVFSQEGFQAFAADNLVLFLADFPRRKPQSEEERRQNEELAGRYQIQGFPTVLLLDAEGTVLARTGYRRGGPEAYVAHLRDLMSTGKQ